MNPATQNILQQVLIWLVPGLLAITLHEVAHGWVASRLGDPTARDAGRLTLNPIRHIDPVGTLLLPGLMLLAHLPFLFGWAKPVPVDFRRLRGGRWGVLLVAMAGPLANLAMMGLWLGLARVAMAQPGSDVLLQVALSGVAINLVLMLFNLAPIPPLDGGRALGALLPEALARPYRRLEPFGFLIVVALLATGVFAKVFTPALEFLFSKLGVG
ncbi:MAG: site-2 protease family protein [Proteobacteria bacterium]|nr:site-2 protease family protein [Pseudomonadota bacterium]